MLAAVPESASVVRHSGVHSPVHQRKRTRASARRQYEKRKAAGMCGYFGCAAKPLPGKTYCRTHLKRMSKCQSQRLKTRKRDGLCIVCGSRPQFWGLKCVICRQTGRTHPLPHGARRALRAFRDAEVKLELEQREAKARYAVRKILASGDISGARARALRLYAGLAQGRWRNGVEVAKLMGISRERVRQLLYPSKVILSEMLGGDVPWKPLSRKTADTAREKSWRQLVRQKSKSKVRPARSAAGPDTFSPKSKAPHLR